MSADNRCMIPAFVQLDSTNIDGNKEKLARAGVSFPLGNSFLKICLYAGKAKLTTVD